MTADSTPHSVLDEAKQYLAEIGEFPGNSETAGLIRGLLEQFEAVEERDRSRSLVEQREWATGPGGKWTLTELVEDQLARLRAAATDVRLQDAQTMGELLDVARGALREAWSELERAEQHHRWHHEREGREVEPDDERLRVLMVIAEAQDSLGEEYDGSNPAREPGLLDTAEGRAISDVANEINAEAEAYGDELQQARDASRRASGAKP